MLKKHTSQNLSLTQAEMFSTSTLATKMQCCEESVRRACRDGRIAAVKCGRQWRIPKAVAEHIFKSGMPIANE